MLSNELQSLLESLRQRIRRYVVFDSLLAIAVVVLSAFWIGLAIDYGPVLLGGSEMPRSARAVLLLVVGALVLLLVFTLLIARLFRPLPDDSLALLVERVHPKLGGRLITAVELTRPGRTGDEHAPELLRMVHREATQKVDEVDPTRVFRPEPLIQKSLIATPMILGVIVFAFLSPSAFARAAGRLSLFSDERWPRRAMLEMVGVDLPRVLAAETDEVEPDRIEFAEGVVRLPKGSSPTLRIRAAAGEDRVVPSLCTVYYETDDGTRGQSNMRRVGRERDGFQAFILDGPPLSNLTESFTFSVRGLDDRLNDFRIEAIEPPTLTEMNVRVRLPDYLRSNQDSESLEFDLETPYEAGLRISEGSVVTLEAKSSIPLGKVDAAIDAGGEAIKLDIPMGDDPTTMAMVLPDFRSPTSIRLVPSDEQGIAAQSPFRYFLGAVIDEPPTVDVKLSGIEAAITPIARLPIECEALDDYAVTSLQAFVTERRDPEVQKTAEENNLPLENSLSTEMRPDRDGLATTVVDLRELTNDGKLAPIAPGSTINVFAEAMDGYDLDGEHRTVSERIQLRVVTAAELLRLMEKRELGLRTRLEQTLSEMSGLRDQLARFRADRFEITVPEDEDAEAARRRELQILRLRVQQSFLQANKTSEELTGIAESLDDLLQEMVNNRVDSPDRRERLGSGVRDPLRRVVEDLMSRLQEQITAIENAVDTPPQAVAETESAIETADEVVLALTAVLEKMLYLESYNEILDLVRGLIEEQDKLKADTQKERKKAVLDLFD
ncbi:MAG: polyketide synthase [Planctomycetota bacterium]